MFMSTSLTPRAVCESCSIRIAMWNQSRMCSECGCKKPGSERTPIAAVRQERHALAPQYALRGQDFIQSASRRLVNRSNECEHLGVAVLWDALSGDNIE